MQQGPIEAVPYALAAPKVLSKSQQKKKNSSSNIKVTDWGK